MPTVHPPAHAPVGVDKCFKSRLDLLEDKKPGCCERVRLEQAIWTMIVSLFS